MKKETREIKISSELYNALEKQLVRTSFKTVDKMAESLLMQSLSTEVSEVMDEEEEEQIKKRLTDLGYL